MHPKRLLLAATMLFTAAIASNANAHAKLVTSDPTASSTVDAPPPAVRLTFNEAPEPAFSKITLVSGANNTIAPQRVEVDKGNPKVLLATLPQLRSGQYRVEWSAVTHDGHRTKGAFTFAVK